MSPDPSPTRLLGALIVTLALTVAACTPPAATDTTQADPVPADPVPADPPPVDPPDAPEPDLAPRPDPVPDPSAPDDCDPTTRAAIGSTVSTQLDAFASEDFEAAYAMTSPSFRLVFATDDFESMIRTDYPELVGNGGHRFDECRVRSRRAFLLVGVRSGAREVVLRYDLSEEADGWRIDGAGWLSGVTLPADPLI